MENQNNKIHLTKILYITGNIIGLIIIIVLIIGGSLLAGHIWDPQWNPFK